MRNRVHIFRFTEPINLDTLSEYLYIFLTYTNALKAFDIFFEHISQTSVDLMIAIRLEIEHGHVVK